MPRVEFILSMPGRASWNGRWSGESKRFAIIRTVSDERVRELFDFDEEGELRRQPSWSHRWSDGWCAVVTANVLPRGKRAPKSDGFNGYDWMVDNIIKHGRTLPPGEEPA